jgi:signal transduction histidine kinase
MKKLLFIALLLSAALGMVGQREDVDSLVNNALKHSGATTINLQLVQSKKHVSLTVQDDGCGFDDKTVEKGYGLENIHNRVASCRGKLDITSSPGKGTETVIEMKAESFV